MAAAHNDLISGSSVLKMPSALAYCDFDLCEHYCVLGMQWLHFFGCNLLIRKADDVKVKVGWFGTAKSTESNVGFCCIQENSFKSVWRSVWWSDGKPLIKPVCTKFRTTCGICPIFSVNCVIWRNTDLPNELDSVIAVLVNHLFRIFLPVWPIDHDLESGCFSVECRTECFF